MKKILLLLTSLFLLGIPCKAWEVWCSSTLTAVYVYTWDADSYIGDRWPGTRMTKVGDNLWYYKGEGNPTGIIFNWGSESNQTEDLRFKDGGIYGFNNSDLTSIEIPNSVTSIENSTFKDCSKLRVVKIPNSVTSIGNYAFYDCSGLTNVTIPNSVTSIGNWAFSNCSGLTSVEIPNSVTSIGNYAFSKCSRLTSIEIPNSLTSIGNWAFSNCSGLTSVEIPNSVTSIGNYAFYDCSGLTNVTIPNSVTSIGDEAFYGCSGLTSVVIPNSVTEIGRYTFYSCRGLLKSAYPDNLSNPFGSGICISYPAKNHYIEDGLIFSSDKNILYFAPLNFEGPYAIPNSVTEIGDNAFAYCQDLTSVTIPNSVTEIGSSAFYHCFGLLKSAYPDNLSDPFGSGFRIRYPAKNIYIEDGLIFSSDKNILYFAPLNFEGPYAIPNSVTEIGDKAFAYCQGLTSVTIGNFVTTIGDQAFRDCSGLTSVTIPNSVTEIGGGAFLGCSSLTSVSIPNSVTEIRDNAFAYCQGLTSVTIPNSVTEIGDEAFYRCSGLNSIELPNSLTSIRYSTFYGCSGLTNIKIPNSVTEIEDNAFLGCSGLKSVEISNSVTSIGDWAFDGCGLTKIILKKETPPSYYSQFSEYTQKASLTIPDGADFNAYLLSEWRNFLSIDQENGDKIFLASDDVFEYRFIESLGEAFLVPASKYSSLTSASIPDRVVADRKGEESFYRVTGIGPDAFKECTSLTQVKLPGYCELIGNSAFSGCYRLTSLLIPNSVTFIGESAFHGCRGLTSVEIPNLVTSIGDNTFYGCNALTSIVIPNSITEIGNNAFYGCSGLKSIEIPNSVNSIGDYAFCNCSGLINVEIPNSVKSMGTAAFANIEFENCIIDDAIEALEFTGENKINSKNLYFGRTINGPIAFSGLDSLEVSGFVESIPSNCFTNNPLTSLVINPGSGIVIEAEAFKGCKSLAEITLPNDIAEIGDNAFSGTGLKNVTIPNGTIGANAFAGCNLDNIIIGAGVESIGEKAFDGSNALKGVYATPTTPPAAENNTFSYYEAQLYVPEEAIDTYYNNPRCWYRFSGKPLVMPENIVLEGPADITGKPGETFQLIATILPSNVTLDRVLWRSTNPAVATVDNNGLVTIHNFQDNGRFKAAGSNGYCEIIASTLYEDSPVAVVKIEASAAAIDYVNADDLNSGMQNIRYANDIYTLQGVCLKHNATQSDIDALAPGMYIILGKKVIVK